MDLNEYERVIDEARGVGAKTVRFAGWGEPFCDEFFYDESTESFPLIDYANKLGLYVVCFTNGSKITKQIARNLVDRDVSIIAKMNSFAKSVQDKIVGKKGAFEMMQRGIRNLLDVGFNRYDPPRLGVESIISKYNYEELPTLYSWLRRQNIIPYFEMVMHGGRGRHFEKLISKTEARSLFEKLLDIDEREFGFSWFPVPPYVGFPCDKLYYNLVVSDHGECYPCYGIDINLGNVREKSLKEILQNSELGNIRNVKNLMHGNCSKCRHHDKCEFGCRCDAYNMGDIYGDYTMCWHEG